MKRTNKIKKLFEANYSLKRSKYEYFPKTNKELRELIDELISKYGDYVDLNNVCVSYVNDFRNVFLCKETFNGDVSEWDVSNGLDFNYMFYGCKFFNSDLYRWDVSNVQYFYHVFEECYDFNSELFYWNVSNGINFDHMFYNCKSFNADLSGWDVSNAKRWFSFAKYSLLEKYPERIPEKFRKDYL
jgi:surface protein